MSDDELIGRLIRETKETNEKYSLLEERAELYADTLTELGDLLKRSCRRGTPNTLNDSKLDAYLSLLPTTATISELIIQMRTEHKKLLDLRDRREKLGY